nr:hypothetical protein GCM10020185_07070 [Pseudomonas brassicacearum subsp. brassicacearum]
MKRSAFFISDGTGITAETLGQSLLAQFENITFAKFIRPYIDSVDKARAMVQQINKAAETDGFRPIIFDTIVNQDIREILATSNGFMIDIFFHVPGSPGAGTERAFLLLGRQIPLHRPQLQLHGADRGGQLRAGQR